MNSAVRPIFNKSFVEKRDLWICEQCMRPIGKAEKLKPLLKKKKKKRWNVGCRRYPNINLVYVWIHVCGKHLRFMFFFFFFFVWGKALFWGCFQFSMSPVYCSRNPQTFLFCNFFIKNGFHDTIHTFKNYFVTVFSVFNKIKCIQMDP